MSNLTEQEKRAAVVVALSADKSPTVSDLGLHSYSLKRGQFLTDSMKESRMWESISFD